MSASRFSTQSPRAWKRVKSSCISPFKVCILAFIVCTLASTICILASAVAACMAIDCARVRVYPPASRSVRRSPWIRPQCVLAPSLPLSDS
ncbi:UNVERIFIED_CONTAM: hypothetical protein Sangu_3160100 [Sesamum angustifolium]|uniref:Uncharacterized protein n=1 Tax=Sesamum angustifolium TaxID=2727405 RepID=A0AAW2JWU1_9LAMI